MNLGPIAQIFAFSLFSFIAIAGALGMTTTMSMFRSGIFLMASFMGVAGLFILLLADLLGLLQIMMYIGGMLVMILFMVLFSHDPGGAMMAKMKLPPIEKFFSLGLTPHDTDESRQKEMHHEHGEMQHDHAEMQHEHAEMHHDHGDHQHQAKKQGVKENGEQQGKHEQHGEHGQHSEHGQHEHMDMDMSEMAMMTPIKPYAAVLAALIGVVLVALLLFRPAWPIAGAMPDPESARRVGSLLMDKYMIAFEGAGLLILLGIFGAVLLSRPGRYPDSGERGAPAAVDDTPAPIETELLEPYHPIAKDESDSAQGGES